mgnify:FL=1
MNKRQAKDLGYEHNREIFWYGKGTFSKWEGRWYLSFKNEDIHSEDALFDPWGLDIVGDVWTQDVIAVKKDGTKKEMTILVRRNNVMTRNGFSLFEIVND